jgi:hypothetical protein
VIERHDIWRENARQEDRAIEEFLMNVVTVAVDLACQHAAAGHSVGFASAGGSFLRLLENSGVEHFAIDQDWTRPLASARGFFKLQRAIEQHDRG